jgi:hypothetical protein
MICRASFGTPFAEGSVQVLEFPSLLDDLGLASMQIEGLIVQ